MISMVHTKIIHRVKGYETWYLRDNNNMKKQAGAISVTRVHTAVKSSLAVRHVALLVLVGPPVK